MDTAELYSIFLKHPVVTTDSRNCPKDSIFFALKGETFDGNDYIEQALQNGAAFAVGDRTGLPQDKRIICVDNALHSLQSLATYHRKKLNPKVIAVTGTNGKTTTKELIAAALSTLHPTLFTQGNLNNHIGVPLTLLQLKPEHYFAVIEMGANHQGEIRELCHIADPGFGLITNVGKAHLEGFGSFEGVVRTKTELYEYIREKDGVLFVNFDNSILKKRSKDICKFTYGTHLSSFVRGEIIESEACLEMEWRFSPDPFPSGGCVKTFGNVIARSEATKQSIEKQDSGLLHSVRNDGNRTFHTASNGEGGRIKTQLVGNYNFENVLATICVAVYFGAEADKINQAIADYTPKNNRSQSLNTKRNHLIVDAYNANPSSIQVALDNFLNMKASPKMAIIGEMKELGEYTQEEHQRLVDRLRESAIDRIILCGGSFQNIKSIAPEWNVFTRTQELLDYLQTQNFSGFHILIKGSRTNELEKTIEFL